MKKKIIIILTIVVVLVSVILIVLINNKSKSKISVPNTLSMEINNNKNVNIYLLNFVWQYPNKDDDTSSLSTPLVPNEKEFKDIKLKLDTKDSVNISFNDTLKIDISNMDHRFSKEINNVNIKVFDNEGKEHLSKKLEVNNNVIEFNLNELENISDMYIKLVIECKYSSYATYCFKTAK